MLNLTEHKGAVLISLRVTPRGRANAVNGVRNGVLLVSVTAPPADGAANGAVVQVLSAALRCPKSAVVLHRGEKSRDKVVAVSRLSLDEVRERLQTNIP